MFCKLYLKRKFQKNISDYICIFVIMIASIMLINIPSVYLDASDYGELLNWQYKTGGYDVRLTGALSSDIDFFSEVQGIETTYKDGCIYIKIDDSVDWEDTANKVSRIANKISDDIDVTVFAYRKSAYPEDVMLVDGTRIVATFVGMLSIYYAYRLITVNRKEELKKLTELGIDKKTLRNTLIVELSVIFAAALAVAVPISNFAVKLVLDNMYIQSDYTSWMVYDYKFSSFILLVILSALALGGAFFYHGKKLLLTWSETEKKKKLLPVDTLTRAWSRKMLQAILFLQKYFSGETESIRCHAV